MSATGRRGVKRKTFDVYNTPTWLTEAIIPAIAPMVPTYARVLEPACGEGKMLEVLQKRWPNIVGFDIQGTPPVDFLTEPPRPEFDLIITNPPYKFAKEFVDQALKWRKDQNSLVVMMLRLNFLGSMKRATWLRDNMPSVYITPKRPKFVFNKAGKLGSDATEYSWFVWSGIPEHKGKLFILDTENIKGS